MSYIVLDDLKPLIPSVWLTEALDDDHDGEGEMGGSVIAAAEDAVNGVLSTNYRTPVEGAGNFPFLKHITRYHAAWILYSRRGYDYAAFPHRVTHEQAWKQLTAIGKGDLPLGPSGPAEPSLSARPKGAVITTPSRLHSKFGTFTA